MRVLVTGATSSIGVALINSLLKQNDVIIYAVVRKKSKNINRLPQNNNIIFIEMEYENYDQLPVAISQDIDITYHFAWDGIRGEQRNNRELQQKNYLVAIQLFYAIHQLNCKKFVGSGSQAEYGFCSDVISEDTLCKPDTEYGKFKLETCLTLRKLAADFDIDFFWIRIFSLYGEYDYENSLIMSSIKKMEKNEEIRLTTCTQKWDYLNIRDAVEALILLEKNTYPDGIYNLAYGKSRKLKEFIEDIRHICNSSSDLQYGTINGKFDGFEADCEKIKKTLNWEPKISFWQGIKQLVKEKQGE